MKFLEVKLKSCCSSNLDARLGIIHIDISFYKVSRIHTKFKNEVEKQ